MEEVFMQNKYYVLQYAYEVDDPSYICIERYAFIGVFSSEEKANKAIDFLLKKKGFIKHQRDCFNIMACEVNKSNWLSGFV